MQPCYLCICPDYQFFETKSVRFYRNLAQTVCVWDTPQTEFIPMGFLFCQWNSSTMEVDWSQARKVNSWVQTQVSPREVCNEHNGTGTSFPPGTSDYPSQCSLTDAPYSFIHLALKIYNVINSTRSPFVSLLSRRAQSGRWSSSGNGCGSPNHI